MAAMLWAESAVGQTRYIAHSDTSMVIEDEELGLAFYRLRTDTIAEESRVLVHMEGDTTAKLIEFNQLDHAIRGRYQVWYQGGAQRELALYSSYNNEMDAEPYHRSIWYPNGQVYIQAYAEEGLEVETRYLESGQLDWQSKDIDSPNFHRRFFMSYYENGLLKSRSVTDLNTEVGQSEYYYPMGFLAGECLIYPDTSYTEDPLSLEVVQVISINEDCTYYAPKGTYIDEEEYDFILGKMMARMKEDEE